MRSFLNLLIVCFIFGVCALPAVACINDRESQQSEKEFKSSYIENQTPPASPPDVTGDNQLLTWGGGGLGVALLVGACALCVVRQAKE
jgi:hypothetical protein